jgi:hypothetical protein
LHNAKANTTHVKTKADIFADITFRIDLTITTMAANVIVFTADYKWMYKLNYFSWDWTYVLVVEE